MNFAGFPAHEFLGWPIACKVALIHGKAPLSRAPLTTFEIEATWAGGFNEASVHQIP